MTSPNFSTEQSPHAGDLPLLDLFSTSQKTVSKCINHAPYLCVPEDGEKQGYLAQGCCNSWECPRCGELRARHEYGRIVVGAREISTSNDLYFLTITCRGDISLEEAEKTYLENTNRLLSVMRAQAKKNGKLWSYAGVTERQRRGHPHSHYLISFVPIDAFCITDDYERYCTSVAKINASIPLEMRFSPIPREDASFLDYHSEWLALASVKAGLGVQIRISIVDSTEACSRYIAKYLFKNLTGEIWPKGWKRVRYSQNWPKLPEKHNPRAFVILSAWDWHLAADSGTLRTTSYDVYERALRQGLRNVVYKPEKPE